MTCSNSEHIYPSFFKILLDDSSPNLPLPLAFLKKHGIPENPVLETSIGRKWKVEIKKIGANLCFVNGWLDFMRDTKTEVGDFLVFRLICKSTFTVTIYGPSACAKDLSFLNPTPSKYGCNLCGSGISNAVLKNVIKIEDEDLDDDVENEIKIVDDDDDVEEEDMDEENEEEEEEDSSDDDEEEEEEEEEEEGYEDIDVDTDEDEKDNKEEEDDGDDDDVKEIQVEHIGWKEECLNPSFEKVFSNRNKYSLALPKKFVEEIELNEKRKTVVIRSKERKTWKLNIGKWGAGNYYLRAGWPSFWKENNFKEGDTYSFDYSNGLLEFEAVKKVEPRKRGRPRLDKKVEPTKRGRGRPRLHK